MALQSRLPYPTNLNPSHDFFISLPAKDAHEFLGQCLDQLKEDIIKPSPLQRSEADETTPSEVEQQKSLEAACPVARNFECQVSHNIECEE